MNKQLGFVHSSKQSRAIDDDDVWWLDTINVPLHFYTYVHLLQLMNEPWSHGGCGECARNNKKEHVRVQHSNFWTSRATTDHPAPQSAIIALINIIIQQNQILHVLLAQLGSLWGGQVVTNVVCKFCCNLRLDVGGWVVISANKVRRKHHHIPTSFNIKYSLCQSAFAAWLLWAKSKNKCGAVHVSKTLNYVFTEAYLRPDST